MIYVKKITVEKKNKLMIMMADPIKGRRATEGLTSDKRLYRRSILIPSKLIPVSVALSK